jgi:phage-related holin
MYTFYIIKQVFTFVFQKLLVAIALIPALIFDPAKAQVMYALLLIIGVDFLTGLFASAKTGQPIVSRKIYRSAVKLVVYSILIMAARLTESSGLEHTIGDLDGFVVIYLAVTELVSILENIGRAGYIIPRKLLNKLLAYRDGDDIIKSHIPDSTKLN